MYMILKNTLRKGVEMPRLYIQTILYRPQESFGFSFVFWMRKIGVGPEEIRIEMKEIVDISQWTNCTFYPLLEKFAHLAGIRKLILGEEYVDLYFKTDEESKSAVKSAKEILRDYLKKKEMQ